MRDKSKEASAYDKTRPSWIRSAFSRERRLVSDSNTQTDKQTDGETQVDEQEVY